MKAKKNILLIVPVRNEEKFLSKCIDSLLSQKSHDLDITIVCIDGASNDKTKEIIETYAEKSSNIVLLNKPEAIKPISINMALSQYSDGVDAYFIFDGHSIYPRDYIESCLDVLNRTHADVVGGYWDIEPGNKSFVGRLIADTSSHCFGMAALYRRKKNRVECEYDCVPFGCFRGDFFKRYGTFDERMVRNQDSELFSRAKRKGAQIVLSPEITITYYCRSTLLGIMQNCFNNGRWNIFSTYLLRRRMRPRHYVPMFFVLAILAFLTASIWWPPSLYMLAAMISIYFLIGAGFAFYDSEKHYYKIPLYLAIYFLMHTSYGFGSLAGLLTLPNFAMLSPKEQQRPIADRIQ